MYSACFVHVQILMPMHPLFDMIFQFHRIKTSAIHVHINVFHCAKHQAELH